MIRQAVLFTPGDERRMVEKSLSSEADVVNLDIEDAVAPSAKETACETVVDVLESVDREDVNVEVAVRINPLTTRGEADLAILSEASNKIDVIVLPKVEGENTVSSLMELLDRHEFDADIIPIIETPESLVRLEEIALHERVVALEFGAEDFTTEIGGISTSDRSEVIYARQRIVVAAAIADIDAIDMAWPNFRDTDGLRQNAEAGVRMGYDGKCAIHPVQIDVIKEAFTPTPEQIERSRRIVDAATEAEAEGKVVFQLDGEMIDPPIIDRAYDILERAPER